MVLLEVTAFEDNTN